MKTEPTLFAKKNFRDRFSIGTLSMRWAFYLLVIILFSTEANAFESKNNFNKFSRSTFPEFVLNESYNSEDSVQSTCVQIINDSLWCNNNSIYWNFCVKNPDAGTLNPSNAVQIYMPPGVILLASSLPVGSALYDLGGGYYLVLYPPLAPGEEICGITLEIQNSTPGELCLPLFAHYGNAATGELYGCCTEQNIKCITIPECESPCADINEAIVICNDGSYDLDISLTNTWGADATSVTLHPLGYSSDITLASLADGATGTYPGLDLSGYSLTEGDDFCFEIILHHEHLVGAILCDSICRTDTLCLTVPPCETCICGNWIAQQIDSVDVFCNESINVSCNADPFFHFEYLCGGSCTSLIEMQITNPDGIPVAFWTGNGILNASGLIFDTNGDYVVNLSVHCGTTLCDSCSFIIHVDCGSSCCGTWGTNFFSIDGGVYNVFECETNLGVPCNVPINFQMIYACADTCTGNLEFAIENESGVLVSSGFTTSFIPFTYTFITGGIYTVKVTPYCGGMPCEPCKFNVTADCPTTCCGDWIAAEWTPNDDLSGTIPLSNGSIIDLGCDSLLHFHFEYACLAGCQTAMQSVLTDIDGNIISTPIISSSGWFDLTFSTNGNYILTLNGSCSGEICDPINIYINVSCEPVVCCGEMSVVLNNLTESTSIPLNCGDNIDLSCNTMAILNIDFKCLDECQEELTALIIGPLGDTLLYASGSSHITSIPFVFTETGTYYLTITSLCNTSLCKTCEIRFYVACETTCCRKWSSITLKDAFGFINSMECGGIYSMNCLIDYDLFAEYACADGCMADVDYEIWNDTYTSIAMVGTFSGGSTLHIPAFPSIIPGRYHMILKPSCGGFQCAGCVIDLIFECIAAPSFTIFPNPSSNKLTIQTGEGDELISKLVVLDNMGNTVLTKSYSEPQRAVMIDISLFSGSLYTVQVNGHYVERIIKE